MIYKNVSIKQVVSKIIRDLGLGPEEISWEDMIEWMAEGLEHIGAHYQFKEKEGEVVIENFTGTLPCDFYKLVRLKGGFSISQNECTIPENVDECLRQYGTSMHQLPADLQRKLTQVTASLSRAPSVNSSAIMYQQIHLIGDPVSQRLMHNDYKLNGDVITTGFQNGLVRLQYIAWLYDEEGFPLIPDDVSYRDAMFWKVTYHMSLRGFHFKNQRLQDSEYCRQMWNKYCMQSRASANMPDAAMLERLKNNWMRLIPNFHPEQSEWKTIGRPQNLNLDGRY